LLFQLADALLMFIELAMDSLGSIASPGKSITYFLL
jgi:hypothetical protein